MTNTPYITLSGITMEFHVAEQVRTASAWLKLKNSSLSDGVSDSVAYAAYVASCDFGLRMADIISIILIESGGNPKAVHPYLPKYRTRAVGTMGIIRKFHKRNIPSNIDLTDPYYGTYYGALILSKYIEDHGYIDGIYLYSGRTKGYLNSHFSNMKELSYLPILWKCNNNNTVYKICYFGYPN